MATKQHLLCLTLLLCFLQVSKAQQWPDRHLCYFRPWICWPTKVPDINRCLTMTCPAGQHCVRTSVRLSEAKCIPITPCTGVVCDSGLGCIVVTPDCPNNNACPPPYPTCYPLEP